MKRVFVTFIRQATKAGTDRELEPWCGFDSDDFTRTSNHDTLSHSRLATGSGCWVAPLRKAPDDAEYPGSVIIRHIAHALSPPRPNTSLLHDGTEFFHSAYLEETKRDMAALRGLMLRCDGCRADG